MGIVSSIEQNGGTMVDIQRIVPGGVLVLYSAWSCYELTTQIPDAYYVAVETHRRVVVPDNPRIQLCYWQKSIFWARSDKKSRSPQLAVRPGRMEV